MIVLTPLLLGCKNSDSPFQAAGFVITSEENKESQRWGKYLFQHLNKRTKKEGFVFWENQVKKMPSGFTRIHIFFDPQSSYDYSIKNKKSEILIALRSERAALWMIYQLIDKIASYRDFIEHQDLPPAYISFSNTARNFDFEYREPHYRQNYNQEYAAIVGTHNVDLDWGNWGHNLPKILNDHPELYAHIDGRLSKEQYCFSSEELHTQLKNYIEEKGVEGNFSEPLNYMIAPNDNELVCTCDACKKLGNSTEDNSPSVLNLLNKLAVEFPKNSFYTTAYLNISNPPEIQLAANVGIMMSSIELPKGRSLTNTKAFKKFKNNTSNWFALTDKIYLWDYAANFDDYLSPIPTLKGLQTQLKEYKSIGIQGVFLNASGYDYSSFDDLKHYVTSALMIDCELNIDILIKNYLLRFYPQTSEILADYLLKLENHLLSKNKGYEMYQSFLSAKNNYLNLEEFRSFYNRLNQKIKKVPSEEKQKLAPLLSAMHFSYLQAAYIDGLSATGAFEVKNNMIITKKEINDLVQQLEKNAKRNNLSIYKETEGEITQYIHAWNNYNSLQQQENLLTNKAIQILNKHLHEQQEPGLLSDGILGFSHDYQQGWFIANNDLELQIDPIPSTTSQITIRFLKNKKHKFSKPKKIILKQGDRLVSQYDHHQISDNQESIFQLTIPIKDLVSYVPLTISISKDEESNARFAIDEVQFY